MAMRYHNKTILLTEVVGVEEAEELLGLLQNHPNAKLDLSACLHLHTANLQVLMATRAKIKAWPADARLAQWLHVALTA